MVETIYLDLVLYVWQIIIFCSILAYEIRREVDERGDGVFARAEFKTGEVVFGELPTVLCRVKLVDKFRYIYAKVLTQFDITFMHEDVYHSTVFIMLTTVDVLQYAR